MSTPFKKIPVEMRDHLGELTPTEWMVWSYVYFRTDKEGEAFPSNQTIADAIGLHRETVKIAKKGLRDKGYFVKQYQRRRSDGMMSTVVEKACLPWQENTATDDGKGSHGTVAGKNGGGKKQPTEVDTYKPEVTATPIQAPQEGFSVFPSVSQSGRGEAALPETFDKQNPDEVRQQEQPQPQNPLYSTPGFLSVLGDVGNSNHLCTLLGIPYFTIDHNLAMQRITNVLLSHNRSVDWLVSLLAWVRGKQDREAKFWHQRLGSGERAVMKLVEYLEKGTIVAQFDFVLLAKEGLTYLDPLFERDHHSTYLLWARDRKTKLPLGILSNGTICTTDNVAFCGCGDGIVFLPETECFTCRIRAQNIRGAATAQVETQ